MINFLFVCTGNTCRSPMAEAVLRSLTKNNDNIQTKSAGLFATTGSPANEKSSSVLTEKGIPISHQSQPLTVELLEWATIILTMTMDHKQAINQRYPTFTDKIYTLKEYVFILEGKEKVWEEINQLQTEIEMKRMQYYTNQSNPSTKSEEEFLKEIELEYKRLMELEQQLPDFNIADPYGGSISIYRETRDEIIALLHKLYTNQKKN